MHMKKTSPLQSIFLLTMLLILIFISACKPTQNPVETELPQPESTGELPAVVISTPTEALPPTPTEIPAAAIVNGEVIPLSYYQNELLRYRDSQTGKTNPTPEAEIPQVVLNYLIEQQLLAQAAHQAGFSLDDQGVQAKVDQLVSDLGSGGALTNWMQVNHYDDAEFRLALRLAAEAAWQRDQIIQAVPDAVEQVRAQQIFASTQAGADRALNSLNVGADFNKMAWEYSPESGGELGWFPRGYLLYPEVEEAAFSLAPGSYSGIIQSAIGYHILLVLGHEEAHPLTTDAKVALQTKALENWLQQARANAIIEVRLP
jgi:peptidyl-prolyl cis-trans isomerase C